MVQIDKLTWQKAAAFFAALSVAMGIIVGGINLFGTRDGTDRSLASHAGQLEKLWNYVMKGLDEQKEDYQKADTALKAEQIQLRQEVVTQLTGLRTDLTNDRAAAAQRELAQIKVNADMARALADLQGAIARIPKRPVEAAHAE